MKTLTLSPSKLKPILAGHPWVFPKAIVDTKPACQTGELVRLTASGNSIGVGVYNPHSLYRVRVLAQAYEQLPENLEAIVLHRLQAASLFRKRLNLPNDQTNAFRLVNSEGDGLSGLTVDMFHDVGVISSSAYWVEANRELILACLKKVWSGKTWLWFSQKKPLMQDGYQAGEEERPALTTTVKENGVAYNIHFESAQKTGLFLDQRENHARLASYAKDARVLDLYSYTGGFALQAARAGASTILGIDSAQAAIERAQENAVLNNLDNVGFEKGDARDYLDKAHAFDIVVLDPPKLAPSKRNEHEAKQYYRFLHREVFKAMRSGSLLMTCNCSSAFSPQAFQELVYLQALAMKKIFRMVGVYGAAACHPTLPVFPEGRYLTAVLGVIL